ncbi:sodium:solute symporter [Armatimonas sp.]|uniref:sodium:solute symporter family protein n=1 Tax=Armatimonas sp. TaxID=1872638 RepID=UPI00374D6288
MRPEWIVFAYLAAVLYIGIFAFKNKAATNGEDFFLASRKLGPAVFLLSLFGTNMTAVAILGSSGFAYQRGIGVFGLMASSSAIVIPLTLFFIGTRLWGLGKQHGHMTQVQFLRDRWEMSGIGTFLFGLTALMLVPYIIIGVMGGGDTLETISGGRIPYAVGGAIVALVVMSYVFFGGMRGTAWVNAFQTTLFLAFGVFAFTILGNTLGGFDTIMAQLASKPATATLLSRERIPPQEFFSYMFIPLSAIMFPHIAIMCMTAEKVAHFKKTVVLYPLCIAAIWLPSVYLGVVAAAKFPGLTPGEANDVIIRLLAENAAPALAGIFGAGIMACVMASDSQILALSTMFTEDLFAYYGGRKKYGQKGEVVAGRAFIVAICVVSYLIALQLKDQAGIFELAIRFAFSGFAALAPIMLAALFWKRSTKWGALAACLWVVACLLANWQLTAMSDAKAKEVFKPAPKAAPAPQPLPTPQPGGGAPTGAPGGKPAGPRKPPPPFEVIEGNPVFLRGPVNVTVGGFLPVFPMVVGSALLMLFVSLGTKPPSKETIEKYFPSKVKK